MISLRSPVSIIFLVLVFGMTLVGSGRGDVVLEADDPTLSFSEPTIAASPNVNGLLLAGVSELYAGTNFNKALHYSVSMNGGATWDRIKPLPQVRIDNMDANEADPSVGFDRNHNAWYVGLAGTVPPGQTGCDLSLFITRNSDTFSGSWDAPTVFMPHFGQVCHDKPFLAIDNTGLATDGRKYVTWAQFQNTAQGWKRNVHLTYSLSGTAFKLGIPLSEDGNSFFPDVDVAQDGYVYVSWVSYNSQSISLVRFNPADSSVVSYPVRALAGPGQPAFRQVQSLAADPVDSNVLYIVYEDKVSGNIRTHTDIFITKSTDRGQTWSTPKRVNDDGTQTDQFLPWISTTAGAPGSPGRVDVVFYDKRHDDLNLDFETWFASSADRGETFQPNEQVSNVQYAAGTTVKDYIGMASTRTAALPIWTGPNNRITTDTLQFYDLEVRAFWLDGTEITPASPAVAPTVSLDNLVGGRLPAPLVFSIRPGLHNLLAAACFETGSSSIGVFDHWDDLAIDSPLRTVNMVGDRTGTSALRVYYVQNTQVSQCFDLEVRTSLTDGTGLSPGPAVSLDDVSGYMIPTTVIFSVSQGNHEVLAVACKEVQGGTLQFDHWEPASNGNVLTINVQGTMLVIAFYTTSTVPTCGGSVAHGTLITMADGTKVPVQNL